MQMYGVVYPTARSDLVDVEKREYLAKHNWGGSFFPSLMRTPISGRRSLKKPAKVSARTTRAKEETDDS